MGADRAVTSGPETEAGWPVTGPPRRDRRHRLEVSTGAQWVQLPEKYGNWRGVYNRLRTWSADGT
ncbi:transposase [Streptomyces hyderabadensis]|uniref:transposase n=1 Tax=Streptomyces hyderabadensis TaxID=598549 RepID=UPI003558C405